MSERGEQVQRLLAGLAKHADLVAEAFEGSVSGGDRQRNASIEALSSLSVLKPYDEDSYRLNPRLREFIADYFTSYQAFQALRRVSGTMQQAREQFDVVVLDPPAFAKSKGALEGAARGYKEINLRALKLLVPGGFLVTCSCSYHMDPALFRAVVEDAALDAHRRLRLLAQRAQAIDHPILVGYDESHYLKCLIYEVI